MFACCPPTSFKDGREAYLIKRRKGLCRIALETGYWTAVTLLLYDFLLELPKLPTACKPLRADPMVTSARGALLKSRLGCVKGGRGHCVMSSCDEHRCQGVTTVKPSTPYRHMDQPDSAWPGDGAG